MTVEVTESAIRSSVTLLDGDAPTEYTFPVSAKGGALLSPSEDGGVTVSDHSGTQIASIAAPWAIDARGSELPTHYRIEGANVIPVIDTKGAVFPVVADPSVEVDCGHWYTPWCTWGFDRTTTARRRDVANVLTIAAGAGAVATPVAAFLALKASQYYDDGDCLGIRMAKTGRPFWPVRVQR